MRVSRLLCATLRQSPANTEIVSHQLMLRAGMIRQVAAGIYTWLPLGLRVLRKVETIVREEMDRSGAQEVLMPGVQPADLWRETGRWDHFGVELLRFSDRRQREFCLGPTHEEIITDLARNEIRSYRQLPINLYQIQTKFRDELRPRFGLMRAREFLMKDAYSFHLDQASLEQTYECMFSTYGRILERVGLVFRAVRADSGNIGGALSHEFHVLADSGEDRIVFSEQGDYAANMELAEASEPMRQRPAMRQEMRQIDTPDQCSVEAVADAVGVTPQQIVKTLIVKDQQGRLFALLLRGDHQLNLAKAGKLPQLAQPVTLAEEEEIRRELGCGIGSLGPLGLRIPVVADHSVAVLADFVVGANHDGRHYAGLNWGRDLPLPDLADLRNVQAGDMACDGSGPLKVARGIEVGHIFQLGTKYSDAMKAHCMDENGHARSLLMGCYGMGISRVVAAAIEQNHDTRGIIWPAAIAPFQLVLIPVNMHKSRRLQAATHELYQQLQAAHMEVLLDDRRERPGVMFADAELMGIPHRLVLSDRGLDRQQIEYRGRRDVESRYLPRSEIMGFLRSRLSGAG